MMRKRKILVIANETVAGEELHSRIKALVSGFDAEVLVVAPALSSRVKYFLSDEDAPRALAGERLERSLKLMRQSGVVATGSVGDADPVRACEDATAIFEPDHVVISTHPPGRSNWLERDVVERIQSAVEVPVTHVVVDLERIRAIHRG